MRFFGLYPLLAALPALRSVIEDDEKVIDLPAHVADELREKRIEAAKKGLDTLVTFDGTDPPGLEGRYVVMGFERQTKGRVELRRVRA